MALAMLAATALVTCAPREGDVAPALAPRLDGPVWPSPPDRPRYAYAGTLTGEADFLDPAARERSAAEKALAWFAGLVIGPRRLETLSRPVSGLVRADGSVLVVDAGRGGVALFDMTRKRFELWDEAADGSGFASPIGIAADGAGGYLVTDSELARVIRLDAEGRPAGAFGAGILSQPTGIARDPATGNIYVADTAAHDIKLFRPDGTLIDIIGGPGRADGRFNAPTLLTFADDRLYVADTLNFRVQVLDREGAPLLDFGELGLFVGDMSRPKGVAVGRDGRIYVVESYYDHLLVFDPAGRLLLPIGGTGSAVGRFFLPSGVWTDAAGRVYVADMFNGRVAVFAELTGLEEEL